MRASNRSRSYRQDSDRRQQAFHNSAWLTGAWIGAAAFLVAALWHAYDAATGTDPSLWWWAGSCAVVALFHLALAWLVIR